MKLARFDGGRVGLIDGPDIVDVTDQAGIDTQEWPPVGMIRLIDAFSTGKFQPDTTKANRRPLADVRLETPVPWPNKLIAYPVNYHAHGKEMNAAYRADVQGFFLKPITSLSGPNDAVVLPELSDRSIHHECELAIVVGRTCRNVPRESALDYIFGYSCLIDVTVRGKEERVMRKGYDTFCPVGPWITTADEVGDASQLDLKLWVNDELRQSANTRDLVLDIPGMIAMASSVMTLYPGDIIATGTPEGVGPIVSGDTITIEIERVGKMSVPVVQGQGGSNIAFAGQPVLRSTG
jgi:2-keto-4-pentenoate hydratase/2-oxohepta-3-ene-1,7-dioic acid hydratase in catechol pathway